MNTTGDNTDFAAQSKDAASNAADKIQDAVRDTKSLSIDKVRGNAQTLAQQGRDTIDAAVQQARDTAADVSGRPYDVHEGQSGQGIADGGSFWRITGSAYQVTDSVSRLDCLYLRYTVNNRQKRLQTMGRGILLWMLGVPLPIILLLAMCSHR
jgi:hypothetical protein